jgi:hypothetical protein
MEIREHSDLISNPSQYFDNGTMPILQIASLNNSDHMIRKNLISQTASYKKKQVVQKQERKVSRL